MANASVTRLGQANLTGDTDALFLKVFSGEVLAAFEERNVMMPLHSVRISPRANLPNSPSSVKHLPSITRLVKTLSIMTTNRSQ